MSDWQASNEQQSGAAYTSYNNPSGAWQPVAAQQTVPAAPAVERFVDSGSRDWNLRNSNAPLNFPLSHNKPSNPPMPQPGPNTGSSTHGGGSQNVPPLVYEEVFQYPKENAAQSQSYGGVSNTAGGAGQAFYPGYPYNAGAQQVASPATGSSSAQMSYQLQNPVGSLKENVFVRVSDSILPPPPPPPPPSSYIVQSRDAYQRVGFLLNKSRYSPGVAPPLAVRSGPARRQPAAPVGVKSPQRYVLHLNVKYLWHV